MKKLNNVRLYALAFCFGTTLSHAAEGFSIDKYDTEQGKTLRAMTSVSDVDLRNALTFANTEGIIIKAVNLVDQGFIGDQSLTGLALLPDLHFLNIENTRVTSRGLQGFIEDRPDVKVIYSFDLLDN